MSNKILDRDTINKFSEALEEIKLIAGQLGIDSDDNIAYGLQLITTSFLAHIGQRALQDFQNEPTRIDTFGRMILYGEMLEDLKLGQGDFILHIKNSKGRWQVFTKEEMAEMLEPVFKDEEE